MKNKNWFWGLIFIGGAALLLISQLVDKNNANLFNYAVGVVVLALVIHSIVRRHYFFVFVPPAIGYLLVQNNMEWPPISPWLLIAAGVLVSIGFEILFPKQKKQQVCCGGGNFKTITETVDDDNPNIYVRFGSTIKYLHAANLQKGSLSVSLGSLEVYLDQVTLDPNGAELNLDCSLGELKLYLPRHWRVNNNVHISMADIKSIGNPAPMDDAPTLTLTGSVRMGSIEVRYI